MSRTNRVRAVWKWVRTSVWAFPLGLLLVLIILTSLKISGSSVGMYHQFLYGETKQDENLLFGQPRSIRSDEWLVNTQMTMDAEKVGYPLVNENISDGLDMSVIGDTPYREWSTIFKPQNLAFLVLPLEYAFAFKWWLILYLLIISCYFFTLRLFPDKKLLSILLALGFGFSPFVWWWYLSGTLAPLFYGFFIMILMERIINKETIPRIKNPAVTNLLHLGALSYVLTCFALTMYPPYQIPVAVVVGIFFVGTVLKKLFNDKVRFKKLLPALLTILAAGLIAIALVAAFFLTRLDTFKAVTGTVYPGPRVSASKGLDPLYLFNSYLQPELQNEPEGYYFLGNQSESANFALLLPFLLLPGFAILVHNYRKHRTIDWLFLTVQLGSLLVLVRTFLPKLDPFYLLLPLNKIPHERPIIGLGLISFLQLLMVMRSISPLKIKNYVPIVLYGLVVFAVLVQTGLVVREAYPAFLQSLPEIILPALVFAAIPVLVLCRKLVAAAGLIALFCFASIWQVNPLYKGLGLVADNEINRTIHANSRPGSTWVAVDHTWIENIGLINDRHSISGVNFYPDLDFWRRTVGDQYSQVYNRYAHIIFSDAPTTTRPLMLGHSDIFLVKLECSDFVLGNVDYAVSIKAVDLPCVRLVDTVHYPAQQFFIYQLVPVAAHP